MADVSPGGCLHRCRRPVITEGILSLYIVPSNGNFTILPVGFSEILRSRRQRMAIPIAGPCAVYYRHTMRRRQRVLRSAGDLVGAGWGLALAGQPIAVGFPCNRSLPCWTNTKEIGRAHV